MPINPKYMIAPSLQELFRDKDTAEPLAAGVVTFYKDQARTVPKSVYKLSGSPPNYSYVDLGNEITLTGIGTFSDNLGNDIVPYFYPYDDEGNIELYYVTVESAGGVLQFTREGWPNFSEGDEVAENYENFIPNGQFLAHTDVGNVDPTKTGLISQAVTEIAQGGWTFERPNSSTATDYVKFFAFNAYVANPDASPRFAVEITCQSPDTGDTYKDLRLTFGDVNKFASDTLEYTYAFSAINNGGSANVSLVLIKNFGTGGSTPTETTLATFTIGNSYAIYQKSFTVGSNASKTIGSAGDDKTIFALRFPTSSLFDISLTDFVLTPNRVTVTQFPTQTNADMLARAIAGWMPAPNPDGSDLYLPLRLTRRGLEFDHAEVGKVYSVTYATPGVGELMCDGEQYENGAYSSDGIPYKRLWQVLWDTTQNFPRFGTGRQYLTVGLTDLPAQDQLLAITNRGDVAALAATVDGTPPTGFTFDTLYYSNGYGVQGLTLGGGGFYIWSNFSGAASGTINAGTSTFALTVILNNAETRTLVQITPVDAAGLAGKYFQFANNVTQFYVWFKVDGAGSDPAPGGTGIEVKLKSTMTSKDVGTAICGALNGFQCSLINCLSGSTLPAGSYFTIYTALVTYYVWYTVDGSGVDPKPSAQTAIPVAILSTDTAAQVATKTLIAMNSKYFAVPDYRGMFLRGWDDGSTANIDPDFDIRWSINPFVFGNKIGSNQLSAVQAHVHTYLKTTGTGSAFQAGAGYQDEQNNTAPTGGAETRPINTYVNYVIKY